MKMHYNKCAPDDDHDTFLSWSILMQSLKKYYELVTGTVVLELDFFPNRIVSHYYCDHDNNNGNDDHIMKLV